jgi:hypothetical protein
VLHGLPFDSYGTGRACGPMTLIGGGGRSLEGFAGAILQSP